MEKDFLIVSRKILPDYLDQVIKARELLASHEVSSVTEAVKKAGISRSTFYKYKDSVYRAEEDLSSTRKAVFSLLLRHEAGSLSEVLTAVSEHGGSVLTISQSLPVAGKASVLLALDISSMSCGPEELMKLLKAMKSVCSVHLDSME